MGSSFQYRMRHAASALSLIHICGAGVSIEALIEYMQLFEQGEQTATARKTLLEEQRELVEKRIADMQAGLDRLNAKIENYEEMLAAERVIRGDA